MRPRQPEFVRHERFTAFHAALLVFAMDAAGCFLVRAAALNCGWSVLLWIPLLFASAYGWALLFGQRHTGKNYLLFGVLLVAVNLGWALLLTVRPSVAEPLRTGFLGTAAWLAGLGVVVTAHALWAARRRRATSCTSGPA